MDVRGTVIAALLVSEVAIVGLAVAAIRGVSIPLSFARESLVVPAASSGHRDLDQSSSGQLVEDGSHQIFEAGAHPALTVNIGYADLTIRTSKTAIDVSVRASRTRGMLDATAPITTRRDGDSINIATTGGHGWVTGDDRMVTVLVPPQTTVTVVNAGDITANGLRAEASLSSIGRGSITVQDYDAPALRVECEKAIDLRNVVVTRLDAKSDDSHVEGTALQVRDGTVESDGHITLGFTKAANTVIEARTSDGKISVSGFAAAAPSAGGSESSPDDDDSSTRTVRVGTGNGYVTVHSSDGNIMLTQAS